MAQAEGAVVPAYAMQVLALVLLTFGHAASLALVEVEANARILHELTVALAHALMWPLIMHACTPDTSFSVVLRSRFRCSVMPFCRIWSNGVAVCLHTVSSVSRTLREQEMSVEQRPLLLVAHIHRDAIDAQLLFGQSNRVGVDYESCLLI